MCVVFFLLLEKTQFDTQRAQWSEDNVNALQRLTMCLELKAQPSTQWGAHRLPFSEGKLGWRAGPLASKQNCGCDSWPPGQSPDVELLVSLCLYTCKCYLIIGFCGLSWECMSSLHGREKQLNHTCCPEKDSPSWCPALAARKERLKLKLNTSPRPSAIQQSVVEKKR